MSHIRRAVAAALILYCFLPMAQADGSLRERTEILETPTVEVVGISPVKGLEIPRNEVPARVQSLDATALETTRLQALPELMGSRLGAVNVNEIQSNPYQADVNFRGFTASPLLGTPQGISVYQDGVRINEPFGDIVNWDLIPRAAVSTIDLIPGSNPLFGLNTLGGALSITTKSGLTHRERSIEGSAGSFGRRELEAEFGRGDGDLGFYLAGSLFREDGWRDFSPSRAGQWFGKLSQQRGPLEWDLSYTGADTDLIGNGLLPQSMLERRRSSIFTKPDNTRHRLDMLALNTSYWLDDKSRLTALAYHRRNVIRTLNGDANDDFEGDAALDGEAGANGGAGFNRDTAANNRTRTVQRSWGGAVQWSRLDDNNHVAFGATLDQSKSHFEQTTQLGIFDADRGVTAAGAETLNNRLNGRTSAWSLFATDTYRPIAGLAISSSLRYNHARVQTVDQGPRAPALDGDYTYTKLNPSLGATWDLTPSATLFANLAQGNRAPSPIELGCADRNNPCSLPNAMQADPFLKQVVTRTWETGLRGKTSRLRWNATAFRADNRDDILFVGTGGNNSRGYFTNFGRTRREGIELGAAGDAGAFGWRADYSYVKATYQSAACLLAGNNSTRGQGGCAGDEIRVLPGHRLPGIPLHNLKMGIDWRIGAGWQLSADVVAHSRQFLRGNENNAHQAGTFGGRTFLGPGHAAGYGLLNLGARAQLDRRWVLSARLNNAFDRRYATAGALAENPFNAAGNFQTNSDDWTRESFFAPGAPRNLFVGLAYSLD